MAAASMRAHRRSLTDAWERFQNRGAVEGVRPEVAASWDRSLIRLAPGVDAAPVDPEERVHRDWESSPLRSALAPVAEDLERTARDFDLVAALTDESGRILWSAGGRHMRDRAAAVNFVPGGHWDEASVGTNALDLALRTGQPASVFSAEHFSPFVHGWACYAAPITDSEGGPVLGVLDLSTTWDRAHPMALATVTAFARTLSQVVGATLRRPLAMGAAQAPPPGLLRLEVQGRPRLWQDGTPVMLTQRQAELLLALALHPGGLTVDEITAHVYGDLPVTATTVKVEVSRLRRVLPGAIESRPYRINTALAVDALEVLARVAEGDALGAVEAFTGDVLPTSEAPVARDLALRVEVGVRSLVLSRPDAQAATLLARRRPEDLAVVDHALHLLDPGSPQRALVEAGRAVTLRDT